jgi:hypothetical protein
VIGACGVLYGTTWLDGSGSGTVFQLTPPASPGGAWTETTPYSFTGGSDGGQSSGKFGDRRRRSALWHQQRRRGVERRYGVRAEAANVRRRLMDRDCALQLYRANQIGRITTEGTITEYPIPTPDSGPNGITAGPDGALWFTESCAGWRAGSAQRTDSRSCC